MNLLDQTHWALLGTLHEGRTVTEAAALLGITQSAATQRLREAERRMGVPLVSKAGRHVVLTEAGMTLAKAALATQPLLRTAESEAIWRGKRGEHRLRMLLSHFDSPKLIMRFAENCKQADASLAVEVVKLENMRPEAAIDSGQADIGLLSGQPEPARCTATRLRDDWLVGVFPLGQLPETSIDAAPQDFAGLPFLTYGLRPEPGWEYDVFFERGRLFPSEAVRIESTELICRMVAQGYGASILPGISVKLSEVRDHLKVAPLRGDQIRFSWHLISGQTVEDVFLNCFERALAQD